MSSIQEIREFVTNITDAYKNAKRLSNGLADEDPIIQEEVTSGYKLFDKELDTLADYYKLAGFMGSVPPVYVGAMPQYIGYIEIVSDETFSVLAEIDVDLARRMEGVPEEYRQRFLLAHEMCHHVQRQKFPSLRAFIKAYAKHARKSAMKCLIQAAIQKKNIMLTYKHDANPYEMECDIFAHGYVKYLRTLDWQSVLAKY